MSLLELADKDVSQFAVVLQFESRAKKDDLRDCLLGLECIQRKLLDDSCSQVTNMRQFLLLLQDGVQQSLLRRVERQRLVDVSDLVRRRRKVSSDQNVGIG